MKRQSYFTLGTLVCGIAVLALVLLGFTVVAGAADKDKSDKGKAPEFEVDPSWPKPLPNHYSEPRFCHLHSFEGTVHDNTNWRVEGHL